MHKHSILSVSYAIGIARKELRYALKEQQKHTRVHVCVNVS